MNRPATPSAATPPGAERLLEVLGQLCSELDCAAEVDPLPAAAPAPWPPTRLSGEGERLVGDLCAGLARLAGPHCTSDLGQDPAGRGPAVRSALDAAAFLARSELARGCPDRLPQLLPSFAFLVVLPERGRSEALRLSRRATHLLAAGPEG